MGGTNLVRNSLKHYLPTVTTNQKSQLDGFHAALESNRSSAMQSSSNQFSVFENQQNQNLNAARPTTVFQSQMLG